MRRGSACARVHDGKLRAREVASAVQDAAERSDLSVLRTVAAMPAGVPVAEGCTATWCAAV